MDLVIVACPQVHQLFEAVGMNGTNLFNRQYRQYEVRDNDSVFNLIPTRKPWHTSGYLADDESDDSSDSSDSSDSDDEDSLEDCSDDWSDSDDSCVDGDSADDSE